MVGFYSIIYSVNRITKCKLKVSIELTAYKQVVFRLALNNVNVLVL